MSIANGLRCGLLTVSLCIPIPEACGTDFFLTIGGGYRPESNQASLEANVLFFQSVLRERHRGSRNEAVFFADGNRNTPDLQILARDRNSAEQRNASIESTTPVTDLLNALYTFGNRSEVEYRNHRVPNISGANNPSSIQSSLQSMIGRMTTGDRLLVYVTAHGAEAKGRNPYNTSISCWDNQKISAREFESWLDEVPADVPVILVMAQCYCGGFAHTIFENADRQDGLARGIRVGFFAQQHNLAAAGCRPDIENDEEYSSFFWGAMVGRSRTGRPLVEVDCDQDGKISFAEAHTHAMLASDTIDIPLRASEALLRTHSRIAGYDHRRDAEEDVPEQASTETASAETSASVEISSMSGTLRDISSRASPPVRKALTGLATQLGIALDEEVPTVFVKFEEERDRNRQLRRSSWRGRRGRGSGRRELRSEIAAEWPELGDRDSWRQSELLNAANQMPLWEKMQQLPSYLEYVDYRKQREEVERQAEQGELREVKFQRLVNTLECVLLAENLPKIASPEIVEHYQKMLKVEDSQL